MLLKNTDSFMYKIEAENVYEDWEFLKSYRISLPSYNDKKDILKNGYCRW